MVILFTQELIEDWVEYWVAEYLKGNVTVEKMEKELDRILLDGGSASIP